MTAQTPKGSNLVWFWLAAASLGAALVVYSQTWAFFWDEGFHLLAAQLIKAGKRPYLDFAFVQTPLNAYWNAAWMRILGEGWRQVQLTDALLTTAAVVLTADFLRSRFEGWGTATLIATLFLVGANTRTVEFGAIGQAYALGLFLTVAAFRMAVACVERKRVGFAALAGLLAGAATCSTLLTASVAPVLLVWILWLTPAGKKLLGGVVFVAGVVISWLPVLVLFAQSPTRVIFDVFRYHMFYRRSDWPGATQHDLEIFTSWIDDPQAILLGVLAAAGLWFVIKRSGWTGPRRHEFALCGWLALALGIHVSTAHPTFTMYYVFTIPFLGILAAVGLFSIATQLGAQRGLWPVLAVSLLMCLGVGRRLYDRRDEFNWPKLETLAQKVNEVTPPQATLGAEEVIYFLTRHTPPPGNEYLSSHKLRLPADLSELVHIVPQPEIDRRIAAGVYDTIETCEEEDWIKERKLAEIYRQHADVADCAVFWDKAPAK